MCQALSVSQRQRGEVGLSSSREMGAGERQRDHRATSYADTGLSLVTGGGGWRWRWRRWQSRRWQVPAQSRPSLLLQRYAGGNAPSEADERRRFPMPSRPGAARARRDRPEPPSGAPSWTRRYAATLLPALARRGADCLPDSKNAEITFAPTLRCVMNTWNKAASVFSILAVLQSCCLQQSRAEAEPADGARGYVYCLG